MDIFSSFKYFKESFNDYYILTEFFNGVDADASNFAAQRKESNA